MIEVITGKVRVRYISMHFRMKKNRCVRGYILSSAMPEKPYPRVEKKRWRTVFYETWYLSDLDLQQNPACTAPVAAY
jgi:hypothetical protein